MTNPHIHSITLFNFKSFKGLNTIQPLDPFFNVIAGSNGSGKSNIIDGILFVLGYSAKSLRHKIITDVIYQNDTQLDTCYVELTFSHTENLVIRRELKKGKSLYTINGKSVSPVEINTILKTYNIDNNRFLILQGQIESISMMKPKTGMLGYLEEIIGTTKYEEELSKLNDEFEKMNVKYDSKTTNYKFFEKEYNMLKNENDESLKNLNLYVEKTNAKMELDDYRGQLFLLENKELEKKLEHTNSMLMDLEAKNMKSKNSMCECEKKLTTKKTELGRIESELKRKKKAYNEIDTQNALYEDRRVRLEKDIKKLEIEIENKKSENKQREREKDTIAKEIDENEKYIKKMTEEANKYKKVIEKCEMKKSKLPEYKKVKMLEKKCLAINKEKCELSNQISAFDEKVQLLETLKKQKDSFNENNAKIDEHAKAIKTQSIIKTKLQEIDINLQKCQSSFEKENYVLQQFQKNENDNKKNSRLNSLLKPIEGFIGRLGDLGSAKEELDVAISTAGKGVLNYMVVENTETAEKCIGILKQNNIERTSFIVINKISDYKLKGDFDYLINHIKCEERYKKLFYFALSDTILCKDIKEATRIAMGNVPKKVVTLDGNMIDKSGLMSGGGALSGAMKIQNEKRNLVEINVQDLKMKIHAMTDEKEQVLKEFYTITRRIAELNSQIKSIDIKLIEHKIERVEAEIKASDAKELSLEFDELENKYARIKSEIDEAENYLDSLDNMETKQAKGDISILYEKIVLYENRNSELKGKMNAITLFEIDQYMALRSKYNEEISNLKKPLNYEKSKNEIVELENTRDGILEEINEIAVSIKEIKNSIGSDFDREIEYKNTIDEITEEISKNRNAVEKIKKTKKAALDDLAKYSDIVSCKSSQKPKIIEDKEILVETIKRLEQKHANVLKSNHGQFEINNIKDFMIKSKEYEMNKKDYDFFVDELTKKKSKIDSVTNQRFTEFTEGLKTINKHLKEIYQLITFGGNAELESVDTLDPFSEGIILSVMPPKKSWKNVSMLSGGEKTLSSLALVFALHSYKPSCFYVMDEIDAALDNRNVSVIANYIYEKAKNAQFLIVSLRNNMFELSDTIIGVFKNDGLSKTLLFDTKNMNIGA